MSIRSGKESGINESEQGEQSHSENDHENISVKKLIESIRGKIQRSLLKKTKNPNHHGR
jgi:hypothetical protein